ncbi:hypothetical protein DBIPINDM_007952 (plasmid) [Mesorhizobium sp. AR02]|uniref:hypothetical protein n=1 Tax=Mesorhizobium sp. AR02 TaxID=2865837 RepID=UPI00215E0BA8|nr:hypothetical protein [Mesorhizobium sp. AR02]UVK49864.1 hypothetical protein DBIPINDM_007952 [Mesorhizobium sp. AR02]
MAIASATFLHMSRERDHAACDAFAAMPPADSDPALLQATAERVSAAFNADISVFGPQGGWLQRSAGRSSSDPRVGSSPAGITC